jgi:hypothetical protein
MFGNISNPDAEVPVITLKSTHCIFNIYRDRMGIWGGRNGQPAFRAGGTVERVLGAIDRGDERNSQTSSFDRVYTVSRQSQISPRATIAETSGSTLALDSLIECCVSEITIAGVHLFSSNVVS